MMVFLRSERQIENKRKRIPSIETLTTLKLPEYREFGRLLGKMAIESLALRLHPIPGWNEEIVQKSELDDLRDYVRWNKGPNWPFSYRTLYPVNSIFTDDKETFEVLHEFDFLYIEERYLFYIIAIFGVEFTINMAERDLSRFTSWLKSNDGISPLYHGKNA